MSSNWAPQDDKGRWDGCLVASSTYVCAGAGSHPCPAGRSAVWLELRQGWASWVVSSVLDPLLLGGIRKSQAGPQSLGSPEIFLTVSLDT